VLPASDGEFVEERDGVAGLNRREERAIRRRQVLIAATPRARVVNDVAARVGMRVWIAGVDAPEVGQERDEPPVALIDAVADAMRALNLSPRENFTSRRRIVHERKIDERETMN
jgi:hypothetical protein